jgi:hypothetical protein
VDDVVRLHRNSFAPTRLLPSATAVQRVAAPLIDGRQLAEQIHIGRSAVIERS